MTVWECETVNDKALARLAKRLRGLGQSAAQRKI
jgi:hypothetical protein